MMKLIIKGVVESKAEQIASRLTDLGINPSALYKSLIDGKDSFTLNCPEEKYEELRRALKDLCQVEIIAVDEDTPKMQPLPLLLSLFLDNLLLLYLLKFSVYSQDFKSLLFNLFSNTRAVMWIQTLLSLSFIALYYHTILTVKGSPPAGSLLGLRFSDRKLWAILFYSLPLPALYLISTGLMSLKLLGVLLLSFSVALSFQLGKTSGDS